MGLLSRKDYILRMAQEMGTLLAAVMGLRRTSRHEEALERLGTVSDGLLGVPRSVLDRLESGSAARMLGDGTKVRAYARILREEAEILGEMKRDNTAVRQRSAELVIEATRMPGGALPADRTELASLGPLSLPEPYASEARRLGG
jgi:hypothetical protein